MEGLNKVAGTIYIAPATWKAIREHFSEDDKEVFRKAICGEVICPQTAILDAELIPRELKDKLLKYIEEAISAKKQGGR